jgi:xanthine dehydrogenase accessory protein pucB
MGSEALLSALRSRLDHIFVINRTERLPAWVTPELCQKPFSEKWSSICCNEAARGQAWSLKFGVRAALEHEAEAAVVLLADQPLLPSGVIDCLIDHYLLLTEKGDRPAYVAACFKGLPRPPILFDSALFPALLELEGDQGARKLLREPGQRKGATVEFVCQDYFMDVDTREDYTSLLEQDASRNCGKGGCFPWEP